MSVINLQQEDHVKQSRERWRFKQALGSATGVVADKIVKRFKRCSRQARPRLIEVDNEQLRQAVEQRIAREVPVTVVEM